MMADRTIDGASEGQGRRERRPQRGMACLAEARFLLVVFAFLVLLSGCIKPKINVFPDSSDPLEEHTLQGEGKGKVLLIPVQGMISDTAKELLLRRKQSAVEEIVAQLKRAEKDKDIKAVLLKIDSPGGTVTASDVLYHEIIAYKSRTGAKVVAAMMDVAASGGYYISLTADFILAHPTTITGSIGVIFLRPKVNGLLEKIGVDVEVSKSGKNKDIGSPFRPTTEEERLIFEGLIGTMAKRFEGLVSSRRQLPPEALADISTARIYMAEEALRLGLVDQIGYLDDAIRHACRLASLPENAKVVVYRRCEYPDDNLYNASTSMVSSGNLNLVDFGLGGALNPMHAGLYYLWLPSMGN